MNRAIKYLFLFFILSSGPMFSQYEKDTIYINFNHEVQNCSYKNLKMKWFKNEGLQFNLCGRGVFLFQRNKNSDTISTRQLKDYYITSIEDVAQKVKDFRYKTYKRSPPEENAKAYQFYNKNDIFETYLIEIISDCRFVVYPVQWRNQNIID